MTVTASPLPLYHQVSAVLRHRIVEGAFGERNLLPTEKEIEAEFGVSRISVRKAVDLLEADGLVQRQRGRGTLIMYRSDRQPDPTTSYGPFENLLAMGYATDVRVIEVGDVAALATVADALGLAVGTTVRKNIRVRSSDGQAFSHLTAWTPMDLSGQVTASLLREQPLLKLLERAGAAPEHARQEFSATLASPEVARALEVSVSSPLLSIRRVVHAANGRPIEFLEALYRPDRYRYVSTLSRNAETDGPFWITQPEDRS
mgnify:CR=1 FL=1